LSPKAFLGTNVRRKSLEQLADPGSPEKLTFKGWTYFANKIKKTARTGLRVVLKFVVSGMICCVLYYAYNVS